jgi:hypothetical protein
MCRPYIGGRGENMTFMHKRYVKIHRFLYPSITAVTDQQAYFGRSVASTLAVLTSPEWSRRRVFHAFLRQMCPVSAISVHTGA